ncbi:hypothetical protein PIB30_082725 [Stylosanthes scabra]|uniref:Uncharacterized protein n=1 Tax=Stylosanthes scabra TaxID=79078 RepID=A0ABU6SSD5_9FABA|nr:hypothetical protein [Stylosanthes scabra]
MPTLSQSQLRSSTKPPSFKGIEKGIEKAKEGIGSKEFTKEGQEEKNRVPYGRTIPSCIRTCPWKRFEKKSAHVRPRGYKVKAVHFVDRVSARYRMAESKLRLKLKFQVFGPRPSPFEGPIRPV